MKRRIEQLINGIFEYEPVQPVIYPDSIMKEADTNAILHGVFHVMQPQDKKMKGFLYTSDPRVICEPAQFAGINNEIHYQIDCSGLEAGSMLSGAITICSDAGEYQVPYEVTMTGPYHAEAPEKNISAEAFVEMARKDFRQAYRLFLDASFPEFLTNLEPTWTTYAHGIKNGQMSYQSLEEFLIAVKAKERLHFSVSADQFQLKNLTAPSREVLTITKDTWGFGRIDVVTDARFLRPDKRVITTDEFAGSTFDLNLVFDTNLMHAGKNFARLQLITAGQTITVEVEATKGEQTEKSRQGHISKIMQKEMEALYVKFRLKKIDLSTWAERSISVINSYHRAGGTDLYADLFLVQLFFAQGKREKAFKLLESIETQKKRLQDPSRYAFYLYMTTFFYQEASYVDRVEEEISRMFFRDKTKWQILWILLYLKESMMNDDAARYEAVAEQFRYGCRSRILYLEAYQILKKNPFTIRHLGPFELQLLCFAAKEKILTAEVIRHLASLTVHMKQFEPKLYEVLQEGYQLYPSNDLVKAICQMLMAGGKKEKCYFKWFEKGVENGLRINGLYEYYMETMPDLDIRKMPQVVRMYFSYDNSLEYQKQAEIYRKIVEHKQEDVQSFHQYRAVIESFALDQLERLHLSDDLAVIYNNFLRKNMLTRQTAQKLARLLHMHEVTTELSQMVKAVVSSVKMRTEQQVMLENGTCLVEIYDQDSVIFLEDEAGQRTPLKGNGTLRKMFLPKDDMLAWCVEKAGDFPGILLPYCINALKEEELTGTQIAYLCMAEKTSEFSEEFLQLLRQKVLAYYLAHPLDESLPEFLDQISLDDYIKVDKTALITLLAEEGRCTEAFRLLDRYGCESIGIVQLVRICSRMVLELEFEENTMLVALCYRCFERGKYDDKLLRYMLLYYEGPVEQMKRLWSSAKEFELDSMGLEEKILMLLLFTRCGTQGTEGIFASYRSKLGRKKICKAYINLKSYEYFVKGLPVAAPVFEYIEKEYLYLQNKPGSEEQESVCTLALLQYYAGMEKLTEQQTRICEELLEKYAAGGIRFGFFRRFSQDLIAPYQLDGHAFVEYVCNPASKVTIYYRYKGQKEYIAEGMDFFDGIFVKEFILFYGEEIECYLEEVLEDEIRKSDLRVLRYMDQSAENNPQYEMLCNICRMQSEHQQEALEEQMESYLLLSRLAEEVFTLV